MHGVPILQDDGMEYEGKLAHTKSRWSRIWRDSPKEQQEDSQNFPTKEPLGEEEQLAAESDRLIYNWDTKTLNFPKLRVTDPKDCPKSYSPPLQTPK